MIYKALDMPLPEEALKKVCHHVACIYRDALPNKAAYNCFMSIAYKISIRFAQEAMFKQKYAAGGIGISVTNMDSTEIRRIVYYSVLADMTNATKFQAAFDILSKDATLDSYQQVMLSSIVESMNYQTL